MNANELADALQQGHWAGGTREQAATMLRKQAEEIEYWKEKFEKAMKIHEKEIEALWAQIKHLEAQVYGGTTK
jgi:predicted  nucleic acid-binding Zn-ribbon protein